VTSGTPATPVRAPLRVVIAEDAVLLREGLRRVLTDAGLEVAGTAGDAEQLLQLVAALRPDLVLTDIRMRPPRPPRDCRRRWRSAASGRARP
jgi:DNA-binding NarL/FixJ family response regulator